MDYVPIGFDEDRHGDESQCAPLSEAQIAALVAYDIELARMATAPEPVDW